MSVAPQLATHRHGGFVAGWPIVGWVGVAIAAMTLTIITVLGPGAHGMRFLLRASALTSLLLFSAAFSASSAQQIWRSRWSRWLLANRRYLGVSFAVSHAVHLVAIITLARVLGDEFEVSTVTLVAGSLAYVVLILMTATSFDRSAAWIGRRAWVILHRAGAYYLWIVFFVTYLPSSMSSPAYFPHVAILLVAMGLRAVSWWSLRAR
jgi:hypothetical protein